jgi:hypothetical protein
MQYPISGVSHVGLLPVGTVRLSQQIETRWSTIETAPGVYSEAALAALDSIITFQRQNNVAVYMGLYGTPVFYAGSTPNPTYADNVTKGPWNALVGECANPTSLSAVSEFVALLLNRYNKAGGAWFDSYGETLGPGIQAWETWNEPNMSSLSLGNLNSTGSGWKSSSFYWGTKEQLVDLAYTQYAAIKSIDTSVVITSPGFSNLAPQLLAKVFLETVGAVTGKTGAESCDALAWHPYEHNPPGYKYGSWTNDIIYGTAGIANMSAVQELLSTNKDLWMSEFGVDGGGVSTTVQSWYAEPADFRRTWMLRFLMVSSALGVKTVCPWHWQQTSDTQGNSGDWQGDTLGVQAAYRDFYANVVGKTIATCRYVMGGEVSLSFDDGTVFVV